VPFATPPAGPMGTFFCSTAPQAFFRPDRRFRTPARAAAVKDGPARGPPAGLVLGRSAAGGIARAGDERMVAEVCLGKVGAVAAREVSRFARNSRDWQQLFEMCRVVDTVLIDQETVYAPYATIYSIISNPAYGGAYAYSASARKR
jgi:hypothetical protein